ncbi:YbaB/EbfC family DNA-binding protein [Saccharopolyspora aridisoli]|uniref:YbaB/EbfC family DNA-binding protein n=1 Tax=Saccharopolyspora aridisoli TaxID=2530385 RepID=A0A4R4UUQ6_9PSEU|nr:YbaB/EbfC family nucleoid-associated protein [Saccharopolyspora aridisoli]TDC96207.1 YbaB/EbfC family DNA-binding protein [Saccharopolyspora aridisoli]
MDGNILDPDGAHERLAAWKGRIDKLAADTQAMSEQLKEVRVTATDPGGLVEVTIDSAGALADIKLTGKIKSSDPAAVSSAIMATFAEAKNQLAQRSQEIIAGTMGTDSAAARAIADSVGAQLTTGQEPAPAQPPDDEDNENRSFMEKW